MLNRYGTRLDLGTAEDIAELNSVEEVLRLSARDGTGADNSGVGAVSGGSRGRLRGGVGTGGSAYQTYAASSAPEQARTSGGYAYSGGLRSVGTAGVGSGGAGHLTASMDVRDPVAGGRSRHITSFPFGTAAAGGTSAPPHVDPGYSPAHRSSGGTTAGHALALPSPTGHTAPTDYGDETVRFEDAIPPGRVSGSVSGMRATAPPFYRPQISMEGAMYRTDTVGATRAEEDEDWAEGVGAAELQSDVERRLPSMRGGPPSSATTTAPYPSFAAPAFGSLLIRPQQPPHTHGSPSTHPTSQSSAIPSYTGAVRENRRGGGDDDDSEGTPARPSRVSGRYHFQTT